MEFSHVSVLLNECIENLNIKPDGVYLDGTLGGGGHSAEIAKRLNENGVLIGVDQDENAIAKATAVLADYKKSVRLVRANFSEIDYILGQAGEEMLDGILLDLGVSSHQLDEPDRGFSYMHDAPLDMRMDKRSGFSAYDVVNTYDEKKLSQIFFDYGEERWSMRIAQFIVNERAVKPIETTFELVGVIKKAIPKAARIDGPHPAKRTFQAIRIEVNGELTLLEQAILDMVQKLKQGGRICVITFHSLEDRIVKNVFRELENPCTCPADFPVCMCGKKPLLRTITRKPILPTEEEIESNHRARSAKLRVAERI